MFVCIYTILLACVVIDLCPVSFSSLCLSPIIPRMFFHVLQSLNQTVVTCWSACFQTHFHLVFGMDRINHRVDTMQYWDWSSGPLHKYFQHNIWEWAAGFVFYWSHFFSWKTFSSLYHAHFYCQTLSSNLV